MTSTPSKATAGHTPGPWKAVKGIVESDDLRCGVSAVRGKLEYMVATIENGAPGDFCETEEANARLIAAAPDLLAAAVLLETAEEAHANCDECGGEEIPELCPKCFPLFDDARVKRRAAISRATGEA